MTLPFFEIAPFHNTFPYLYSSILFYLYYNTTFRGLYNIIESGRMGGLGRVSIPGGIQRWYSVVQYRGVFSSWDPIAPHTRPLCWVKEKLEKKGLYQRFGQTVGWSQPPWVKKPPQPSQPSHGETVRFRAKNDDFWCKSRRLAYYRLPKRFELYLWEGTWEASWEGWRFYNLARASEGVWYYNCFVTRHSETERQIPKRCVYLRRSWGSQRDRRQVVAKCRLLVKHDSRVQHVSWVGGSNSGTCSTWPEIIML
jgi:hypothetical protein